MRSSRGVRELDAPLPGPISARPVAGGPAAVPVVVDAELVQRHQGSVWRYLRVLGAPSDAAADLAQEVFVVLLRTPLHDHGEKALRAWLRSTARNLFLAHCRRQRRSPIACDEAAIERAFTEYERDDDGATFRTALERCLELVPLRERQLLTAALAARADTEPRGASGASPPRDEATRSRLRRLQQALRDCVQRRLRHDA